MAQSPDILDGLDAKQLRALAKAAMKKAEKAEQGVSLGHPLIAELADKIAEINKELKLKSTETLGLVLRKMRLGFVLTHARRRDEGESPAPGLKLDGTPKKKPGRKPGFKLAAAGKQTASTTPSKATKAGSTTRVSKKAATKGSAKSAAPAKKAVRKSAAAVKSSPTAASRKRPGRKPAAETSTAVTDAPVTAQAASDSLAG